MSYIIFVLMFLAVCLFVLSYKNKYTFFLGLMIVSITGILFSMLNFVFKTGYYNYTASLWGAMDYEFYLKLSWFKMEYYSIIRMFNISVALYMLSVVTFIFFYFKSIFEVRRLRFYAILFVLILFPLYTILFYAPYTSNMMYTAMHEDSSGIIRCVVLFADIMNYIIMSLYVIAPLALIAKTVNNKKGFINKKRSICILVCLSVVNIYFLIIIFMGFFRKPYIIEQNFASIQRIDNMYSSEFYMILTIIFVILIGVTLFVVDRFSMTSKIGIVKRIAFHRELSSLDRNFINLFHSVKNNIYSYKFAVEKIRTTEGKEQIQAIDELDKKIDTYVKRITFMLNVVSENLEFETEKISLNELVEECISDIDIKDDIDIEIINRDSIGIEMDTFYMREVLMNIVKNSLEAIDKVADERKGKLGFEMTVDGEWAVLKISDNGIGMSKKTKANLFKPFYTTKSRISNWGVGLSFASKIVRFHRGYISVDSTVDVGTDVYIYLPIKNANVRKKRIKHMKSK